MQDWPTNDRGENRTEQQCQRCGEGVSDGFRRVFGDSDNVVYSCKQCLSGNVSVRGIIERGGAASPERRDELLTAVSDRESSPSPGDVAGRVEVSSDD